jgi:nitrogen fixation protein NifU and related proteins
VRLEQIYQEVILDHYKHPHRRGLREPFGAESYQVNPTCGDEVRLRVALSDDGEQITDVSYEGVGCSISQASTSVLTDQVIGQNVGDALKTVAAFTEMVSSRGTVEGDEDVLGDGIAFAGVAKYPARVKCALLGWMALKDALAQASASNTALAQASASNTALAQASASNTALAQASASNTVLHHPDLEVDDERNGRSIAG